MKKMAKCLNVMRSQKLASAGEMICPKACGDDVTNASVVHDGQLIASSWLRKPQFAHFFIKDFQPVTCFHPNHACLRILSPECFSWPHVEGI
jgi:hypothetical protein